MVYIWLSYENLFDDSSISAKSLLDNIPRSAIFHNIALINSIVYYNTTDESIQEEILNYFFEQLNEVDKKELWNKIDSFRKKSNFKILYFNTVTSMMLAHTAYDSNNFENRLELSPDEVYLFLKSYFYANEILNKQQKKIFTENNICSAWSSIDKYLHTEMIIKISQSELISFKYPQLELYKGLKFLEYLSNHSIFSEYLGDFIKTFGFNSWNEYLLVTADVILSGYFAQRLPPISVKGYHPFR